MLANQAPRPILSLHPAKLAVLSRDAINLVGDVPPVTTNSLKSVEEAGRVNVILDGQETVVLGSTVEGLLEVGLGDIRLGGVGAASGGDVAPGLHPLVGELLALLGDVRPGAALGPVDNGDGEHGGVAPGRVDGVIRVRARAAGDTKADDLAALVRETLEGIKGSVELGRIDKVIP